MPSPSAARDPEHWLSRAKEARELARLLADPNGRGLMREIAEGYERLAAEAAARQRASND
jgi:hypothetical protein